MIILQKDAQFWNCNLFAMIWSSPFSQDSDEDDPGLLMWLNAPITGSPLLPWEYTIRLSGL